MSATFVALGTGTDSSTATLTLPIAATPTAGRKLVAIVGFWNANRTPPALDSTAVAAGWVFDGDTTGTDGGGGTYGADAGPRDLATYSKVSDGTETSVTFDLDDSDVGAGCRGYVFEIDATESGWEDNLVAAGSDNTSGTGFSATADSDFGGEGSAAGDILLIGVCSRPDTENHGARSLSYADGSTTPTAPSGSSGAATAGHDGRVNVYYQTIGSTSGGPPVWSSTVTTATGTVIFIRLRGTDVVHASTDGVPARAVAGSVAGAVRAEAVVEGGVVPWAIAGAAPGEATGVIAVVARPAYAIAGSAPGAAVGETFSDLDVVGSIDDPVFKGSIDPPIFSGAIALDD